MTETGLAAKEGTLQEGDLILKVNLQNITFDLGWEPNFTAITALRKIEDWISSC